MRLLGLVALSVLTLAACQRATAKETSATLLTDNVTQGAFGDAMPALTHAERAQFFVGNSFFNQNWVSAPSSLSARDGLGPLFNTRSCSACHFRDGRGAVPASGEALRTVLLRISIPGAAAGAAPLPDPTYGDQLQTDAIPGVAREATVRVRYDVTSGRFADGEPYELRQPHYALSELGYGPLAATLQTSARVAPQLVGIGLLEAVPERDLLAREDPNDTDHDGISGRANWVWSPSRGKLALGRFGWKAEQASARDQIASALAADMGITTRLVPTPNHTPAERAAVAQPNGGTPEADDTTIDDMLLYVRALALPAARVRSEAEHRGAQLFERAGCPLCHQPSLTTSGAAELPALRSQTFYPYTDLLLHDLGEQLSDDRPTFSASGREWRTAPLFGVGLIERVNPRAAYLHDGRARTLTEAIMFHGGEAVAARAAFVAFDHQQRAALVAFVKAL